MKTVIFKIPLRLAASDPEPGETDPFHGSVMNLEGGISSSMKPVFNCRAREQFRRFVMTGRLTIAFSSPEKEQNHQFY
jgi:hypothetical protein